MERLSNKVALVTGGASGLGSATVRALVNEGATVVISDLQVAAGRALAKELPRCLFIEQDVTDELQWHTVIQKIEDAFGALHILVNNAGLEGPFDKADPETTRLTDWQRIHRVNVEGVFLGCRATIPLLRKSNGGSIINVSSTAALVPAPTFMAYGASKAAVRHITKSVALYCARNGSRIRCNSVHPGTILTPMLHRIIADIAKRDGLSVEHVMAETKAALPQGEFQLPEDVAHAIVYLSSDDAKHITGIKLVVDGGITLTK